MKRNPTRGGPSKKTLNLNSLPSNRHRLFAFFTSTHIVFSKTAASVGFDTKFFNLNVRTSWVLYAGLYLQRRGTK